MKQWLMDEKAREGEKRVHHSGQSWTLHVAVDQLVQYVYPFARNRLGKRVNAPFS